MILLILIPVILIMALLGLLVACSGPSVDDGPREQRVPFHALGQEPGWLLDVSPGRRLLLKADYGQNVHKFWTPRLSREDDAILYTARQAGKKITVRITPGPCLDAMSGQRFDKHVQVTLRTQGNTERLKGCGGFQTDRTTTSPSASGT